MGVKGPFKDPSSGLCLENAYISTYKSQVRVTTLDDTDPYVKYYQDPSTKPQSHDDAFGNHNCGKFGISAQVKVYTNEDARKSNLKEINVLNVHCFCNDTTQIYKCIFEKLKEQFENLEDC
jgi:hypothetical protein